MTLFFIPTFVRIASTPDLFIAFITFIHTICSFDCTVAKPIPLYLKGKAMILVVFLVIPKEELQILVLCYFVMVTSGPKYQSKVRVKVNLEAKAAVIAMLFAGDGRGLWR